MSLTDTQELTLAFWGVGELDPLLPPAPHLPIPMCSILKAKASTCSEQEKARSPPSCKDQAALAVPTALLSLQLLLVVPPSLFTNLRPISLLQSTSVFFFATSQGICVAFLSFCLSAFLVLPFPSLLHFFEPT